MGDRSETPGHRDFFICYAEDETGLTWAEWISWTLEGSGAADGAGGSGQTFSVWVRHWDSVSGDNIVERIQVGLRQADRVIVLLSRTFLDRTSPSITQAAWRTIWRQDPDSAARRVLPVRIDDCDPDGLLGELQTIDLVGLTEHEATSRLLAGINAAIRGRDKPATKPAFPGLTDDKPAPTITTGPPRSISGPRVRRGWADFAPVGLDVDDQRAGRPGRETPLSKIDQITRLRHPRAEVHLVSANGSMPAHLWVRERDDAGFDSERVVVACEEPISAEVVDRIAAQAAGSYQAGVGGVAGLRIIIVYFGDRAADEPLLRYANSRFVGLRSLVEYQGILDFRDYVARQTERLERDPLYPPALYIPQRLTRIDRSSSPTVDNALDEVVDWLSTDGPRFTLLLGDPGRGKTFLLHQLARLLPDRLPHLTPMLVELRDLDKSLSLDQLIASHLADASDVRFERNAFRYLLREGRIALLFDGYDELAVRVSYARAAEHLTTLLGAAEGNAKVVVTSRTQHFLTDQDVRTALGTRVEMITGNRLARLESFTRDQVHQFLARRYRAELTATAPEHGTDDPGSLDEPGRLDELAGQRANRRMTFLASIEDLSGLASKHRIREVAYSP